MLGPNPQGTQRLQQPLQPHAVQHHRLPAIADVDYGAGAVVGEQVAALPLGGDVGVGHRLQPRAQNSLVQVLRVAELRRALVRAVPMLRQQANHRLAAGIGLLQRLPPALPGPDTGVRVQIQENLLGQARLPLDQPLLHRDRLAAVPAGMTQENPRHHSPPRDGHTAHSRPESATLDCAPSPPAATGKFPGDLTKTAIATAGHLRHAKSRFSPTIPAANHTNLRAGRAGGRVRRAHIRLSYRRAPQAKVSAVSRNSLATSCRCAGPRAARMGGQKYGPIGGTTDSVS